MWSVGAIRVHSETAAHRLINAPCRQVLSNMEIYIDSVPKEEALFLTMFWDRAETIDSSYPSVLHED